MSVRGIIQLPTTITAEEIGRALQAATSRGQQETLGEWTLTANSEAEFVPSHEHPNPLTGTAEPYDNPKTPLRHRPRH